MSLVRFDKVTKSFGGNPVLENVDFRLEEGEKVCLVGRNGAGKTTVFRLITDEIQPESGTIERMRRARTACLAQMPVLEPNETIFDAVMRSFEDLIEQERALTALEHQIAEEAAKGLHDDALLHRYSALQDEFTLKGGYGFRTEAKRILQGLGFSEAEFALPFHALSGGQRTRLMLAIILLQDADLMLLDEPENHLDLAAREWLEDFIATSPRTVLIISHDRRLLNAVAKRIVEVERGQLTSFSGNYAFYLQQKEVMQEQHQKAYEQQRRFIEKEQRFIERFRYKNTKASQVQSRIKRLEKLDLVDRPLADAPTVSFRMGEVVRSGALVLEGSELSMAYGGLSLYQDLSFRVERGERVGIIGPNGSGKTTLLRHLLALAQPGRPPMGGNASGKAELGHKVSWGLYEQHQEQLAGEHDVLQEIQRVRPEMVPEEIRTYLGRFLFIGDDAFKPVSALSGGELSRLAMAKLILTTPNLLFLDEPTNHLDTVSQEALQGALAGFPGSIVMVSHDRELIDLLVDKLIILGDGKGAIHLGNYSDYRWKLEQEKGSRPAEETPEPKDTMKIRNQERRAKNKQAEREARKRQRELEEVERNIESVEAMIQEKEAQFLQVDPADHEQHRLLNDEYEALKADLTGLYASWEELAEEAS